MKHLLILIFLTLAIADSSAQQPMKWSRLKGPNIGGLFQLLRGVNGEIIAASRTGFYLSVDNGNNWDFRSIMSGQPTNGSPEFYGMVITTAGDYLFYYGSAFPEDSDFFGVYRSTDMGNSWNHLLKKISVTQLTLGKNNSLLFTSYVNNPKVVGYLFESIDNGNSWTEIFEQGYSGFSIRAVTDKYIFLQAGGGNSLSIMRYSYSDNKIVNFKGGLGTYYQGEFYKINDSLLMLYDGSDIYTSDCENPWEKVGTLNNAGAFSSMNSDIIYSKVGSVYIAFSIDKGSHWDTLFIIPHFLQSDYYSINFEDLHKIIYSNLSAIYLSADVGTSWKEIGLPYASIDNLLVSENTGIFANYAYQYSNTQPLLLSSDEGNTWNSTQPSIYMDVVGRGINGTIVGTGLNANGIWFYDNNSSLWKKRSIIQSITNRSIIASDGSKYLYIASGLNLFQSDDNALTWVAINPPNTGNDIYSLDVNHDGIIYFGSAPAMYRSEDHGTTWIKLRPVNDPVTLSYIKSFGATGVLLGTEGDGLLLSNDKGNSWSRLDGKNFDTVTCIAINGKGEIAAGTNRGLWISDTSKHNWSKVALGQDLNLQIGGIDVAQNDDFYVGTYGSSVWKGTRNYNSVKYSPSDHSGMQISPNPTNGKITITLNASSEEQIRLELYDILGRRVAVLADGRYSGENQITFNTSDLSNGIYTLVLSGAQNEMQKIVVEH